MKKFIYLIMFLTITQVNAQMILLDQGVRTNDLWLFPSSTDSSAYFYLPNSAALGKTPDGLPQFSFLRYVALKKGGEDQNSPINEADGGALLHFLLQYGTSENKVNKAQELLREKLKRQDVVIKGPVIFDEASFALVSSIVKNGEEEKEILTVSSAPVLEGSKLAFSFKLNPRDSKILMESFKMDTPDVSIIFQLKFSGYSDTFKAEITADWEQIYKHTQTKKSNNFLFVKEEAFTDIKELVSNGGVELKIMGEDPRNEKLIANAYEKVLDLVYKPVDINKFKEDGTIDDLERAWEGAVEGIKDISTFGLSSVGSTNGYQYREIKQSGTTHLSLIKASKIERHHFITFNMGNLFKNYGDDEGVFKTVNILDPNYMQRDVFISLDGSLRNAFTEMVNSVNVTVKKKHNNGKEELKKIRIDQNSFDKPQAVAYANLKDFDESFNPSDMDNWMEYQYQVIWDFKGGEQLTTKWNTTKGDVNLYIPYEARDIIFIGDLDSIWLSGVKALVVNIRYDFFGKKRNLPVEKITPGKTIEDVIKSYLAPLGNYEYEYRIIPVTDNEEVVVEWRNDSDGIIVLE
ncbi:hypothetical protein JQC67_16805 [Aurantibacter crassamenti]|uniref:hypothetical protein n=1 Tax=Aurantibacter crassamenti TaxID=1837375 RepID=UPI001939E495|nr:hypothetical protein [Aurantibacter crassamenti]MBM1107817.1 hypothetical protein [Aurantibacter crassamenti]